MELRDVERFPRAVQFTSRARIVAWCCHTTHRTGQARSRTIPEYNSQRRQLRAAQTALPRAMGSGRCRSPAVPGGGARGGCCTGALLGAPAPVL